MATRPTFFYSNETVTYFELGDFFAARYDFTDEASPVYLVNAKTQAFAVINAHKLHTLFRLVENVRAFAETDTAYTLERFAIFAQTCAKIIRDYRAYVAALNHEAAEREAGYERDHVRQESRQDLFI